jgi:LacI family transcriptional regulator
VEGFITVDTSLQDALPLPTVCVGGHQPLKGVTNIVLDNESSARIALGHLIRLGHRKIAFMRGVPSISDSSDRWNALCPVARELGIEIDTEVIAHLELGNRCPQVGYSCAKKLLDRKKSFSALFAYDDISAIGALRAFQETGIRVPHDLSLVGFDDIPWAAFQTPSLTTVRQPLAKMGQMAAEALVRMIESDDEPSSTIGVEPILVVRESTGEAPKNMII